LLLALCLAGLAGCGGDGEGTQGTGGGGTTTVSVGVVPIADVAPLYLGRAKGFFREEGLTIRPEVAEGGGPITAAVAGGDVEIGFSNTVSILIAATRRPPLRIIAQGVLGGTDERRAWANLLVRGDGPVESGRDLEGRTIGVNTLNNICEVTIKASLEPEGVDVSTLSFTEVPFSDMTAALATGRVDAVCAVEPVLSQAKAAGAVGIDPFYVRTAPNLTVATYFTTRAFAQRRPGVVRRFVRAINRSLTYAQRHPDEVRAVLPSYMPITAGLARRIRLPTWRTDLNRPTIERLAQLTEQYGLIEEQPDLDELIRPPR
jgi:NitT/TauT family transport system substrate-binding protein